uniref:Uncharacterized protein n=1 Tax=Trichogramma kaykai TaxID=54128 RepID=A0ABD2WBN0_9HYME
MESRKNAVRYTIFYACPRYIYKQSLFYSVKEEPHDNCEDVVNECVDPGVSVKTEKFDESSLNESSVSSIF